MLPLSPLLQFVPQALLLGVQAGQLWVGGTHLTLAVAEVNKSSIL